MQRHVLTYTQWGVKGMFVEMNLAKRMKFIHAETQVVLMSREEASEEQIITSLSLCMWVVTSTLIFFSCVQAFPLLYLEAFQLYCIMSQHLMLNKDVKSFVVSANLIENDLSI